MGLYIAITVFCLGYLVIALEDLLHISKSAVALFIGVVLWVLSVEGFGMEAVPLEALPGHFGPIAELLFFLLGAMTIVELIDAHHGFHWVQRYLRAKNPVRLLWIFVILTFFLSAVLDNLTTTIVMVTLLKKVLDQRETQLYFAGFVIIAANAGGAWSPIGDVTTIMLWSSGHVTTAGIIRETLVPSLLALLVPLALVSWKRPRHLRSELVQAEAQESASGKESTAVMISGILLLLGVPVFKYLTHLPPYMGMLFSLSALWLLTEVLHRKKTTEQRKQFSVAAVLQRIDTPSVLFFLGILLAVGALEAIGVLHMVGEGMAHTFGHYHYSNAFLGALSAIIDNVPLVAGVIGMYPMELYPPDHDFWTLLAYCAGTGGSLLVIGSAAGVAAMGLLKIDFIWYLKHISLLALLGYAAGVAWFIAMA